MQHATNAYGQVAKQTANPRQLEADLLLKAASKLQAIQDGWDSRRPELDAALHFNRKLWSVFMTAATGPDNPLPAQVKQNVANLGIYVMKQTISATTERRPEQLNSLIKINRELAAGLMAHA